MYGWSVFEKKLVNATDCRSLLPIMSHYMASIILVSAKCVYDLTSVSAMLVDAVGDASGDKVLMIWQRQSMQEIACWSAMHNVINERQIY